MLKGIKYLVFVFIYCLATNGYGQCLEITTSENIKVCSSEEGLLSATTNGTVLFSEWTPTNELTNPLSLTSPISNPFDTSYTLRVKGFLETNNLLTNGDFSDGNTGFTSQYEYGSTKPQGYIIGKIGTELFPEAKACEDHTTPEAGGNMLMARVSETANVEIYCQEIKVASNQDYHFQGFATGLVLNSPPVIILQINEEVISIGTLGSFACSWQKVIGDWNSGNNTTAKICLSVSPEDIGAGTDFVLDDLGFYEVCEVEKTVDVETIAFSIEAEEQVGLVCGDSLRLRAEIIPGDIYFLSEWATELGHIVSGERSLIPIIDAAGTYDLSVLTTLNDQTCTATKSITVSYVVTDEIEIVQSDNLHCNQQEITLEAKNSEDLFAYSYQWSRVEDNFIFETNHPAIQIDQPGRYQLQRTDATGKCEQQAEIVIEDKNLQDFTIDLQRPDCEQPTGTILFDSIIGGEAPFSYSIDNGETFLSNRIFTNLEGGTYPLLIQDQNDCRISKTISFASTTSIDLDLPKSVRIPSSDPFQLPLQINNADSLIKHIVWSPAVGLSCTDCIQPNFTLKKSQTYQVIVTTESGCTAQATIQINVIEPSEVYMPTAFSPNQDGQNDVFQIHVNEERVKKVTHFQIFDRYGNLLFSQSDFLPTPISNGWNGEYRGLTMPNGVYVYWVEVELTDGGVERFSGEVGLVR